MYTPSLTKIIAVSPVSLAILDSELKYLAVSNKWISLYHLEDQKLIGKSIFDIFPEMEFHRKKTLTDCLQGIAKDCGSEPIMLNGTIKWFKWEVNPWLDENDKIGGVVISSEDVTHKTNAFLNEKSFQLFMDELPGLCWITDDDNTLKFANKCFFDTLGLNRDVIGKNYDDIFGHELARDAQENNDLVLKSGTSKSFHQTVRDQHGHPQIYKVYKFPFIDESGEGNMIGSVAFNVTKNKLVEEELFQSEAQFKLAFEHSLIGMALLTPSGNFKRVNKSLCDMLGYSEAEMKQFNIQQLTHPDDQNATNSLLTDLTSGKIDKIKFEKRYLHKDGSAIWVVIAATMLYDSLQNPLYYVSQIEDITKRKEIENDLVLSEKKYRTIFENVQDVFYQTDQEGLVTEISPSIELYSGYPRQEIIGKPVSDFYFYIQDRERIIESLRTSGAVIDFEVRLKTKDKKLRYASVNARLVLDNGVIIATEGSMRDVTTRKSHENELRALNSELTASNEQKNKLLSIIGHDLRNPISGSLQLLDLTLADYSSSSADDVHSYLSMMQQELSNANNLLEDLLTWAKSQFNAISFNPEEISDLRQLFEKSIQTISPMAAKKQIEIHQQVLGDFTFMADKDMLGTIIRNLLANAIKFTHKGGNVLLSAEIREMGVLFSVCDTGIGIPEDKLKTLFDKNINYTTYGTSGEKGTGLGLSLCYEFVHKHNGLIWAESQIQEGTCFYFRLPLTQA